MKLKLIDKKIEAGDAISFYFKPAEKIDFKPGQYLFYTLPTKTPDNRGITRYFTISASPSEDRIAITTRINNKNSTFKKTLIKLKIGDEIEANGPDGDFVVNDINKNLIFIAGGIGITPFRSILLNLSEKFPKTKATLLYANRDENFIFKNELESLKNKMENLKIEYFISPAHIDDQIINYQSSIVNNPLFFISGPTPFVRTIRDIIKAQGVSKENIKLDYFSGYEN